MTKRRTKVWRWVAVGVGVVVVVGVGGPFVYIHFIEGPAPAKLTLPNAGGATNGGATHSGGTSTTAHARATSTTAAPASAGAPAKVAAQSLAVSTPVSGTWNVGSGSVVGYRVQEVLIGQNSTAVGRTSEVWGSITVSADEVAKATFTANMTSVKSDQSERNAQFDGRIMDVNTYPTAKFQLTDPIPLGTVPGAAEVKAYHATGDLTMHGVTRPITFTISTERTGSSLYALADINVVFADWDISNPSVGGFVTTQNHGTLEVLLHLTKSAGNPSYASTNVASTNNGQGGPGASGGSASPGNPPRGKFPPGKFPSGKFPPGKFHRGQFPGGGPGGGGPGGRGPGGGGPGGGGFPGGQPGAGGEGGGPNVTVPKTTVPPLTVPTS
jgi:polyisoprenoid-binding protein YceI